MTPTDWNLLDRYLAGECTPDERTRVERWLAEDAGRVLTLDALRAAFGEESSAGERRRRKSAAWARLERELGIADAAAAAPRLVVAGRADGAEAVPSLAGATGATGVGKRAAAARRGIAFPAMARPHAPFVRAAAVLAIAAAAVLTWRAVDGGGDGVVAGDGPMEVVATARGQRATLRLADGTRVTLAAASTLRYPDEFAGRAREVHLEGEAHFDVAHDDDAPFVVRAGGAVAEDLGTAFVVRAYPGDSSVRVVVTSGKVALRAASAAPRQARVLEPGDLGRQGASGAATVERVDTAAYVAWMRGGLVFDATPLPEVLAQIERWYDVELQLADTVLRARRFTGAFAEGATLGSILETMSPPLDVRYERRGRLVVLFPLPPAS